MRNWADLRWRPRWITPSSICLIVNILLRLVNCEFITCMNFWNTICILISINCYRDFSTSFYSGYKPPRLLAPPFILKAAIYGLSKPETIPPFSSRTVVRLRWRLSYANTAISLYAQASRSIRAILSQLQMHAAHVPLFATQFLK